jgi:hypothetical protein
MYRALPITAPAASPNPLASKGQQATFLRATEPRAERVGRSHESLDETRAVVRVDRRGRCCDYGSGGGDQQLHGELVGFSLAPMPVTATTIRQIELELYKAERGFGMPYDADRVAQLRSMLRETRKRKLSQRLAAKGRQPSSHER